MSKPKVSMIVSNLDGLRLGLLKSCVNSLIKSGYQNWELIVVDNASTDKSVEYLQQKFKKHKNCSVVKNPINVYSQGLNLGAKKATGKYLAYFNNDIEITCKYLEDLTTELENDKELAIVQGKLLNYYKRNIIDSAGETMDIYGNPVTVGIGEKDKKQYDNSEEILSASGSACIIKKAIFEKIGGYDPSFGIGYEDMDLALRARRFGYKVKRIPTAVVYHKRAATDSASFIKIQVKWHFNKNRIVTMVKNYPLYLLMQTIPVTTILYLGITFYEWFIHHNWQMGIVRISSLVWCLFSLPKIIKERKKINQQNVKLLNGKALKLFSCKSLVGTFIHFTSVK